ncbi:hypothetical protein GCM10023219_15980 [Stakelama sediminis]|uniref:TolA-binding protein n=1 Tax=Stakelama sediminis TaxID=463200 RepID=A0A840YXE1_9SPHN|nr:tetratricopeptide repeat protein [Stakelama sediminis]MBB5718328.1 TolA-binding protein [Stakelama sediminis]
MRVIVPAIVLAAILGSATVAEAQTPLEARVNRIEKELQAVQRKVFPDGAGRYLQPQITAPQTNTPSPGSPVANPVVTLDARVTTLENQITSLTNQVEKSQYQVQQLQSAFDAYKQATDARLKALEAGSAPATGSAGAATGNDSDDSAAPVAHGNGVLTPPSDVRSDTGKTSAKPDAQAQKVAGVEKPDTGDAPEDAYIYGYRLWAAKLYPQAEKQLKSVVKDYPDSRRASFAQNLLGRSYLDDGKPSLASIAFYDNYKQRPNGERAPDSLYFLGQSLMQLKKPDDACKAYNQLLDVYGDKISASLKDKVEQGRKEAKCQ